MRTLYGPLTATIAVFVALVGMESLLRAYHTGFFRLDSLLPDPAGYVGMARADFHPRLGWVPKVGEFERTTWSWSVGDPGMRNNGSGQALAGEPLLAVGDSFTFGDEVSDHETWPAHLEQILGVHVLNGGVFAYGVDQAVLRAELLLESCSPELVLLALISNDINRTEFSYYSEWKPFYDFEGGEPVLKNVPVPSGPAPTPVFSSVREALSYSFLFNAILKRVIPNWWYYGRAFKEAHDDGDSLTVELLVGLRGTAQAEGADLVVIALATNGRIGDNTRLVGVIPELRRRGIHVLDLISALEQLPSAEGSDMFAPGGHYSPSGNRWVASRIAEYVDSLPRADE